MAVTKSTIPARLAETLIIDLTANSTPEDNVFTAVTLADKIYTVRLDNSNVVAASYLKGQFATTYNVSNTQVIRLYVPGNSIVEYVFPEGWPSGGFSTGFSFIGTSTSASTGAQSDPSGSLKVTLLAGT
tara:strand:- start:429 stop:815 length:387 start_codon:yes stop_codon:yes gene_type:complete